MVTQQRVLISLSAALLAVLAATLWLLALRAPLPAEASPESSLRYVAVGGVDSGNDCTNSVSPCSTPQYAVDLSDPNDEIRLAGGVYTGVQARGGMTQVVYISQTITLRGGYSPDFSAWDPQHYPTTLDAQQQGRVVSIVGGSASPTLQGLVITGGNAHGVIANCPNAGGSTQGCGGGIFVYSGSPIIVNNVVAGNVAATSTGDNSASGGGLCLYYATGSVITGNLILSNTASLGNRGMGGGIHLHFSNNVLVASNQINSNTATTHDSFAGWGGGIAIGGSSTTGVYRDNWIEGNRTNAGATGYGAGIYTWYSRGHFEGNHLVENIGAQAVYLGGYTNARFESNQIINNTTSRGVNLVNGQAGSSSTLANNVIANSGGKTLALSAYSGGPLTTHLLHNTLVGADSGDGVIVETGYVTVWMTNTLITNHTWAITNTFPTSSTVTADHTLFWANSNNGIVGSNPVYGDPHFRNPGGGDYHLSQLSAAIDAGVSSSETTDMDGDPRPIGAAPDIGADEWMWKIYLPLVMCNF